MSCAQSSRLAALLLIALAATSCGPRDEASRGVDPGRGTNGRAPPAPAGRLQAVAAPAHEEYAYDGAGNLIEIRATEQAAQLSITDFNPREGGVGQTVTVMGTGFSPLPSANSVQLAGLGASVTAASPTRLSFAVPAGATSGRISVTVGTGAVESASDFTVIPTVLVSDFTPKLGTVGTAVTITGSNFDPNASGDTVRIGGGSASVTSAAHDSLLATVGDAATSGKITVTTGSSSATSSADFFLIPGTLVADDIGFTSRAGPGSPATVSITAPGKAGLLLFEGKQGQYRSLFVSGVTYAGSTKVTVYEPAGASVFSGTVTSSQDYKLVLPALPRTGTYTIAIQPAATSTGAATIQVFEDVMLALDPYAGPATIMTLARGQNGRCTFFGRPGNYRAIGVTQLSTTPPGASVALVALRPDGAMVANTSVSAAGSWQIPQLSSSGTHTLTVRPSGTSAASLTFILSAPLTGKLTSGGSVVRFETTRPGQQGHYTFDAIPGQSYTVAATSSYSTAATVSVHQPSGASITSGTVGPGSSVKLDLAVLPVSGTYTVAVSPTGAGTGSVDLRLVPQAVDTLVVGDPPKALTLLDAQNGRYTFAASAGDYIGLGYTSLSTTPTGGSVAIAILKPDGSSFMTIAASAPGTWQLAKLPSTGTYMLTVKPPTISAAVFTLLLSREIAGTLATDGTPTRFETSRVGQAGRYSFAGTAGQNLTLQATAGSGFTPGVPITIYGPTGNSIGNGYVSAGGSIKLDLGVLAASGAHTVAVSPPGVGTGRIDLRLVPAAVDTLVVGDPPKTLVLSAAQNGRYTFTASTGDLLSFSYDSIQTAPVGATLTFIYYRPDGTTLGSKSASIPGNWSMPQAPTSGIYSLAIKPAGTAAATLNAQLAERTP